MDSIPAEFWHGVDQFNQRQFYACHDTLETLWIEANEPERTFYQGILQVAVGLYHLSNRNWRGAVILMGEGLHRLRDYPEDFAGLNVDHFLDESAFLLRGIQTAGEIQVESVAQWLFDSVQTDAIDRSHLVLPTLVQI